MFWWWCACLDTVFFVFVLLRASLICKFRSFVILGHYFGKYFSVPFSSYWTSVLILFYQTRSPRLWFFVFPSFSLSLLQSSSVWTLSIDLFSSSQHLSSVNPSFLYANPVKSFKISCKLLFFYWYFLYVHSLRVCFSLDLWA